MLQSAQGRQIFHNFELEILLPQKVPTVFRKFGWRFYFVSFDCNEPLHIHVGDDANKLCKFWLRGEKEVALADNVSFNQSELRKIRKEIEANFQRIEKAFHEHCKDFKK